MSRTRKLAKMKMKKSILEKAPLNWMPFYSNYEMERGILFDRIFHTLLGINPVSSYPIDEVEQVHNEVIEIMRVCPRDETNEERAISYYREYKHRVFFEI